jgi:hypothetical protein
LGVAVGTFVGTGVGTVFVTLQQICVPEQREHALLVVFGTTLPPLLSQVDEVLQLYVVAVAA